jgi:hypothetical protein
MMVEDVVKAQNFRINILIKMYEKAEGLIPYMFSDIADIEDLLDTEDYTTEILTSALMFLCQEDYIAYSDAINDGGGMFLDIKFTSKGIRLVESIIAKGNTEQFLNDFSPITLQQIIINNNDHSNIQVSKIGREN